MKTPSKNRTYIVSNWKMYISSEQSASELAIKTEQLLSGHDVEMIISPSCLHIPVVTRSISSGYVSGQDVSIHDRGAFTGQTSAKQLADFGVNYCLVGHSETLGEYEEYPSETMSAKIRACEQNHIIPILFIGEVRRSDTAGEEISQKIISVLSELDKKTVQNMIFAYEPVWAISSNNPSSPITTEEISNSAKLIRETLNEYDGEDAPILYGGSVNKSNIKEILNIPEISGVVIGSASVKLHETNPFSELSRENRPE